MIRTFALNCKCCYHLSDFPASHRTPYLAHAALLAVGLIYSINFFWAKAVFEQIPPLGLVVLRTLGSFLAFGLFAAVVVREHIPPRKDLLRLALCGFFGAILNMNMFFKGLALTIPVNASVIMTTSPLFVFLAAFALKSETLTPLKVIGVLVAFSGAFMLSLGGRQLGLGGDTLLGDLMILVNAASYGIYLVLVRPLMLKYHLMTIVAWVFFFGALINVPLGLPDLIQVNWADLSSPTIWGAIYVVAFVTIGTYALNGWALKRISSSAVGVYIYLQPVLVGILSFFWDGQPISLRQVLFMGWVMAGVYLVTYRKKKIETTGEV